MKNVLVTGGAGFIGSHTVDLLVEKGYRVRVLDSLERPTHMAGVPDHLNPEAEFVRGDVRNVDDLDRSLRGMDAVIHLAATGGFTPDISRYFDVNSIGTANLLELIQQQNYRVRKLVVASSVGIYGEGAYRCSACGPADGTPRGLAQLEAGRWELECPICGQPMQPQGTPEGKPASPEKAYSISKFGQERLALGFGRDHEVGACAMRYFLTYGPRQSLTNPYTGVISIFASRIFNGLPPIVFEDGRQTRDFVYVGDVARANVLALESEEANGKVLNVGSGTPHPIADVAKLLAELLDRPEIEPEITGEFRPGESRHIFSDISALRSIGYEPRVSLREGLGEYIKWVRGIEQVDEYLSDAMAGLKRSGVVRTGRSSSREPSDDSLSVVIPVYNEAGNVESITRYVLDEVEKFVDDFEVILVNDGSHDGTGALVEKLAREDARVHVHHHPFNIGYGGAQKTGFAQATKRWVVLVPADHQFDVRDLKKFMEARGDADIVGSVRIDRQDTLQRRLVSLGFNWYMRTIMGVQLRDTNWIKLIRRRVFSEIEIESRGFAVDAEVLSKAQALGYRITQIPVAHYPRTWGHPTGISIKNLYTTARELVKVQGMIKQLKAGNGRPRGELDAGAGAGGAATDVAGEPRGPASDPGRTDAPDRDR